MTPIPADRDDTFMAQCALGALINLQTQDAQRHLDAISDDGLQDAATAAKILAAMAKETFTNRGTP